MSFSIYWRGSLHNRHTSQISNLEKLSSSSVYVNFHQEKLTGCYSLYNRVQSFTAMSTAFECPSLSTCHLNYFFRFRQRNFFPLIFEYTVNQHLIKWLYWGWRPRTFCTPTNLYYFNSFSFPFSLIFKLIGLQCFNRVKELSCNIYFCTPRKHV